MAKKKGSWSKGNAPAMGGTKQSITRPEGGKGKLKSRFTKGKKVTKKGGTS